MVATDETFTLNYVHIHTYVYLHSYINSYSYTRRYAHINFEVLYLCAYVYAFITCRVKQIVGFEAKDMIGQEIMNFFHPKEMHDPKGIEHTQCHKSCMQVLPLLDSILFMNYYTPCQLHLHTYSIQIFEKNRMYEDGYICILVCSYSYSTYSYI